MSDLDISRADLEALKGYLEVERSIAVRGIRLRGDKEADANNRKDPRAFAFVIGKSKVIRCARVMDWLPPNARVGILLHEILHIVLNARHGPESEVDVDEFATAELEKTGYCYKNVDYLDGPSLKTRTAKAIECVSTAFLKRLDKYKSGEFHA